MNLISIRKFELKDIPNKIEWINNPENNQYLHYDLPLEYEKTVCWFEKNKARKDRYDAVIEVDSVPVGLIGLLGIDANERKAEYYISMGVGDYKGKGVAFEASKQLLKYAFVTLRLNTVYLYTETGNLAAQKLFGKLGFQVKDIRKNDVMSHGRYVDRYFYEFSKDEYYKSVYVTPIHKVKSIANNDLYIKREDLLPYSFGGNKARKAELFFEEIDKGNYNAVVTYGSSHSNHCRVVANMAAERKIPCYIIAPLEVSDETFNSCFMNMFGAEIITVPVKEVRDTIETKIEKLKEQGNMPYFIPGGGHGNIGTQAYVNCYEEICHFEKVHKIKFDYIFFASGTGTTQAGLVCGNILDNDDKKIIGISIARKNPYGRDVVVQSVKDYLSETEIQISEDMIQTQIVFNDEYIADGYGKESIEIKDIIKKMMLENGIPLDSTYTAKAFYGMTEYVKKEQIEGKKILFIHTGGTPLFFDDMEKF